MIPVPSYARLIRQTGRLLYNILGPTTALKTRDGQFRLVNALLNMDLRLCSNGSWFHVTVLATQSLHHTARPSQVASNINLIVSKKVILSFLATVLQSCRRDANGIANRNAYTQESLVKSSVVTCAKRLLANRLVGSSLVGSLGFSCELLLSLLVAVRDQPVEKAIRATLRVALGFGALDLAVQVAGGLLVDVVVLVVVEVDCTCGLV